MVTYWDQYKRTELDAQEQLQNQMLSDEERARLDEEIANAQN